MTLMTGKFHLPDESIPTFIQEVKQRECIWNKEYEYYADKYSTMNAWKEIAQVMDLPEDVLKSKWKNLRDLFNREVRWKKVDSLDNYTGKWKYFELLWFIYRPGTHSEERPDQDPVQIDKTEEAEFYEVGDVPFEALMKCEPEEQVFLEVHRPQKRTRRRQEQDDCEFDLMYLRSLTPFFKQLDPMRKLIVRSKIQDILLNELGAQNQKKKKKKYG